MKIGIGIPNQVRDVRASVIPAWAAQAEAAGFDTLSTVGRIAYPGVDDTVALAAAAGATSTIGLLSGVLLATVWPPTLLARTLAGIDGVSGGRLSVGIGIGGNRPDDFVVDGLPPAGLGKRLDHDLEVYRGVWRGEPVGGGANAGVPSGAREVPLLFGGNAPASFRRMATWGEGYIAGSVPARLVQPSFDAARGAWRDAGRAGAPRLVALAYFAIGDADRGKANVFDYYSIAGDEFGNMVANNVATTAEQVREIVTSFDDIGADELFFNSGTDDIDDVSRLAHILN
ncbi:MAG TPA: LLM class flavin-dependent oxidoreductase [Pseudonocardiaceae bacterium]|nr:LLM class flavin-dependent oxidoreductase [Pseudonocardiaceae bacterium]